MDNLIRDIKTLFGSSNSTEDELPEKPPPTVKMEPKPNRKICLRRGDHPKDWEPLTFANLLYKAESPKEADNTKKYLDYVLSPLDYDKLEFENSKEADELRQTNPVDPKIVAAAQKIVAAQKIDEKGEVSKETKKIESKAENNTMENTATSQTSKNASADETSEKQKKPPKESIEMKLPLTPVKDPYLIQILKRKIPHDSSLRVVPSQPSNPNEDASQWNTRVCGYSKRNPIDEPMEIPNENNSKLLETDVNLEEKKEEPQEPTSETFEASSLQNYLEARGLLPNIVNTPTVRDDLPSSKDDVQVQSSATPSTSKDDRPSKDEEENYEQPLEMSKVLPSIMKEKLKQSAEETSRYILENYTVPWNREKVENEEPNPEPPKKAPPKQEPLSDLPPSKKVVRKRQPRDGTPPEQVHPRRFKISKEPVKVDLSERLWEHPRDVHNKPSSDPIKEPIKEPSKEPIKTIYSKPVIEEYLVYKTTDVQIPRSTDVKSDAGNLFSRGEAAKYVAESSKDFLDKDEGLEESSSEAPNRKGLSYRTTETMKEKIKEVTEDSSHFMFDSHIKRQKSKLKCREAIDEAWKTIMDLYSTAKLSSKEGRRPPKSTESDEDSEFTPLIENNVQPVIVTAQPYPEINPWSEIVIQKSSDVFRSAQALQIASRMAKLTNSVYKQELSNESGSDVINKNEESNDKTSSDGNSETDETVKRIGSRVDLEKENGNESKSVFSSMNCIIHRDRRVQQSRENSSCKTKCPSCEHGLCPHLHIHWKRGKGRKLLSEYKNPLTARRIRIWVVQKDEENIVENISKPEFPVVPVILERSFKWEEGSYKDETASEDNDSGVFCDEATVLSCSLEVRECKPKRLRAGMDAPMTIPPKEMLLGPYSVPPPAKPAGNQSTQPPQSSNATAAGTPAPPKTPTLRPKTPCSLSRPKTPGLVAQKPAVPACAETPTPAALVTPSSIPPKTPTPVPPKTPTPAPPKTPTPVRCRSPMSMETPFPSTKFPPSDCDSPLSSSFPPPNILAKTPQTQAPTPAPTPTPIIGPPTLAPLKIPLQAPIDDPSTFEDDNPTFTKTSSHGVWKRLEVKLKVENPTNSSPSLPRAFQPLQRKPDEVAQPTKPLLQGNRMPAGNEVLPKNRTTVMQIPQKKPAVVPAAAAAPAPEKTEEKQGGEDAPAPTARNQMLQKLQQLEQKLENNRKQMLKTVKSYKCSSRPFERRKAPKPCEPSKDKTKPVSLTPLPKQAEIKRTDSAAQVRKMEFNQRLKKMKCILPTGGMEEYARCVVLNPETGLEMVAEDEGEAFTSSFIPPHPPSPPPAYPTLPPVYGGNSPNRFSPANAEDNGNRTPSPQQNRFEAGGNDSVGRNDRSSSPASVRNGPPYDQYDESPPNRSSPGLMRNDYSCERSGSPNIYQSRVSPSPARNFSPAGIRTDSPSSCKGNSPPSSNSPPGRSCKSPASPPGRCQSPTLFYNDNDQEEEEESQETWQCPAQSPHQWMFRKTVLEPVPEEDEGPLSSFPCFGHRDQCSDTNKCKQSSPPCPQKCSSPTQTILSTFPEEKELESDQITRCSQTPYDMGCSELQEREEADWRDQCFPRPSSREKEVEDRWKDTPRTRRRLALRRSESQELINRFLANVLLQQQFETAPELDIATRPRSPTPVDDSECGEMLAKVDKSVRDPERSMTYHRTELREGDVTVIVDKKQFTTYKCMLMDKSRYFKFVMSGVKHNNAVKIMIGGLTADAFQYALDWMRHQQPINDCNLPAMFLAAVKLDIPDLTEECVHYLRSEKQVKDLLDVYKLAEDCRNPMLTEASRLLLSASFLEVARSGRFLAYEANEVMLILSDDNIAITREWEVFEAAIRWLTYDWEERECCVAPIISCIRFPLIPEEHLLAAVYHPKTSVVMTHPECRSHILVGFMYHVAKRLDLESSYPQMAPRARTYLNLPKEHYQRSGLTTDPFVGEKRRILGVENLAARTIQAAFRGYKIRLHFEYLHICATRIQSMYKGYKLRQCIIRLACAAAKIQAAYRGYRARRGLGILKRAGIALKDKFDKGTLHAHPSTINAPICLQITTILTMGGLDPQQSWTREAVGREIFQYNPNGDEWKPVGFLPEPMHHAAAVVLNGIIYITGGCHPADANCGRQILGTPRAWSLNPVTGEWVRLPPLRHCRVYHNLVAADGKLYALGGQNRRNQLLSAVEWYDPNGGRRWEKGLPMLRPRMAASAATFLGKIWVVGGLGKVSQDQGRLGMLSSVECYDVQQNCWILQQSIPQPRCFANLLVFSNTLHLVGGATAVQCRDRQSIVDMRGIHVLDPDLQEWQLKCCLKRGRHSAGAAEIGGKLIIFGGISSENQETLCSVEAYGSTLQFLSKLSNLPIPLTGLASVVLPGKGCGI